MHTEKSKRKKTFTGCWTCRARRVKCDEQTPSCQRCRQFGVPCEGYGVRLTWLVGSNEDQGRLSDDGADETQIPKTRRNRRTLEDPQARSGLRWSSPEVDAMLDRIDTCPVGASRDENGVFSVFAVQTVAPTPDCLPSRQSSLPPREDDAASLTIASVPVIPGVHEPFDRSEQFSRSQSNQGSVDTIVNSESPFHSQHPEVLLPDAGSGLTPIEDGYGRNSRYTSAAAIPVRSFAGDATDNTRLYNNALNSANPPAQQQAKPDPPRHLDLLQMPASQRRLIHHWVTFTSSKLVLIDEPHNPCRTMMLPMALRGVTSSSDTATADIATFHAICACAAYNIYELGGRQAEADRELAWAHDQQAIQYLRHNLDQADQHRDPSFAMAIMACITMEAISGNTRRWRVHVEGGLAYLSNIRARAVEMDSSSAFQIHMVSVAILCGCEVAPELKSFLKEAKAMELGFPYYGASSAFLGYLDHMNALAASKEMPDQRELDSLELQLYLNFPPTFDDSLPRPKSTILHHMAQAFYYASLVFFQRSVKKAPIGEAQTLVDKGVMQLEAIESLSQGSAGSVMMWPALVLGAECGTSELQSRINNWFREKRKLGFRNACVMHELVKSLWDSRKGGDTRTSWMDLIAQDRFDIFRI